MKQFILDCWTKICLFDLIIRLLVQESCQELVFKFLPLSAEKCNVWIMNLIGNEKIKVFFCWFLWFHEEPLTSGTFLFFTLLKKNSWCDKITFFWFPKEPFSE